MFSPDRRPRRNLEPVGSGDIIGHTAFTEKNPGTRNFGIRVSYKEPEQKEAPQKFNIKVGYKVEPKKQVSRKAQPKNVKRTSSKSGNVILDPEEPRVSRRKQVAIEANPEPYNPLVDPPEEMVITPRGKKTADIRPRDNKDHFVYDPHTSEKFLNKRLGKKVTSPTPQLNGGLMEAAPPDADNGHRPGPLSPRGRNITRTSLGGGVIAWDPRIDTESLGRRERMRPSQLGQTSIHGFGHRII